MSTAHSARGWFVKSWLKCAVALLVAALLFEPALAKDGKGKGKGEGKGSAGAKAGKPSPGNKGKGAKSKKGKGKGKGKGQGKGGGGGSGPSTSNVVNANVLAQLKQLNPGLANNFLESDPPDRVIKLPNGKSIPIYKAKQFLDVNFRVSFYVRTPQKGDNVVPEMEEKMRRLMALPQFRERVLNHKPKYKISPMGTVSAHEAYNHFRHMNRELSVTADKKFKAPVGGGGGIAAPSWPVWKAMNIFFHEMCHCVGIGHDSGGLSGPIAGSMRDWDRKKLWKYDTVDLNTLQAIKATSLSVSPKEAKGAKGAKGSKSPQAKKSKK